MGQSSRTALASMGQQALAEFKAANPEEKIWNFDYFAAAKMFKTATDILALSSTTLYHTRHSGASFDRVRGFQCKDEVSGRSSAVAQDMTKAVVWRPTTTLSLARSETSWKHSPFVPR